MSTHIQLHDTPPRITCCEVCRYTCSTEWKKYLRILGWILLVLLCLATGYTLGILCIWGISGNPPNEMEAGDFVGAIFMGLLASVAVILITALVGSCVYYSIVGCREYYAKKKDELTKTKAGDTPGFPV